MFLFFACAGPARAEIGITNTLPRAGAGEQGRAAIGRRMARRQIRMFAESLPLPSRGLCWGVATPPFRSAGGRVWGGGGRLGGGEVHQTAGAGAGRRKAAVVQHGGGAASGGIGGLGAAWLVAAEEVMVGLAGHRWPGRAGQAWNSAPPACQPVVGNHGLIPVKLSSMPLPSSTNQFQGKLSPFRLLPIKQKFFAIRKQLRRSKN